MGDVMLVAEGTAAVVTRLDRAGLANGVVDMWLVGLTVPRTVAVGEFGVMLVSQMAIVCVQLDLLPPGTEEPVTEATHGVALGAVAELPGSEGPTVQPTHLAYAEFVATDTVQAGLATRALANCVAWGDVPIGTRGTALAWRACVAGAVNALRNAKIVDSEGGTFGT